jgi:hypothetical protein
MTTFPDAQHIRGEPGPTRDDADSKRRILAVDLLSLDRSLYPFLDQWASSADT